jgi:hypothetical protein
MNNARVVGTSRHLFATALSKTLPNYVIVKQLGNTVYVGGVRIDFNLFFLFGISFLISPTVLRAPVGKTLLRSE